MARRKFHQRASEFCPVYSSIFDLFPQCFSKLPSQRATNQVWSPLRPIQPRTQVPPLARIIPIRIPIDNRAEPEFLAASIVRRKTARMKTSEPRVKRLFDFEIAVKRATVRMYVGPRRFIIPVHYLSVDNSNKMTAYLRSLSREPCQKIDIVQWRANAKGTERTVNSWRH